MKNAISEIPAQFGASADIAFEKVGSAVDVRLTRPKSLNALTHNMAKALYAGLRKWARDDEITHVVLSAETGEKHAFCAGGDIRDLYDGFQAGTPRHAFFRDEYRLNEAIAAFPKPFIALMDGLVMGGGAGISMHGSHRIVTENTKFAMPEVSIGLIPDVGGTYVLPRLLNKTGIFLGLTGKTIRSEECLEAGIATQFCASADTVILRSALLNCQSPQPVLENLRTKPSSNLFSVGGRAIEDVFAAPSLSGVFDRLEQNSNGDQLFADATKRMRAASPLSLCLAFELLKRGAGLSLQECLIIEYRVVSKILHGPDLYEGIRAAIIDRSRPPHWQHRSADQLDSATIAAFFEIPLEGDLTFET